MVGLIYLNGRVFAVIRRRRHLEDRLLNLHATALKAEAAKQAYLLFAVCVMFIVCHSPR